MSCPAETASRMKSKLPACFFISSVLRETTTSSVPRRSASSFLPGEVVKSTMWAPKARANFTPMWPRPPRPTTPTFRSDDFVGAETERVFLLTGRGGEVHDVGSESTSKLHTHVAQAAETDHANFPIGRLRRCRDGARLPSYRARW